MKHYTTVYQAERDMRRLNEDLTPVLAGRVIVLVDEPANRYRPATTFRYEISAYRHIPPALAGVHAV